MRRLFFSGLHSLELVLVGLVSNNDLIITMIDFGRGNLLSKE